MREPDPQDVRIGALRIVVRVPELWMDDKVLDGQTTIEPEIPLSDLLGRESIHDNG